MSEAYKKKLIEVAMPLDIINAEASKEKSIRVGNPSTIHLWWSRKPISAAKAVIFASLIDDPGNYLPEKAANKERKRLFKLISELVKWNNPNQKSNIDKIQIEIMKSTNNNPPPLLDPFCGGGSIPLAGQLLGLESYGSDLNPVAVLISKALIELPIKFLNFIPINPDVEKGKLLAENSWKGTKGLSCDILYYGEKIKKEVEKNIGQYYPKGPNNETIVCWLWCRCVVCNNPACGCEIPLVSKLILYNKSGKEKWIKPFFEGKNLKFSVEKGLPTIKPTKSGKVKFHCLSCDSLIDDKYIKELGYRKKITYKLMGVVTEGNREKKFYGSDIALKTLPTKCPTANFVDINLPDAPRYISPPLFGYKTYSSLFTERQLLALVSFSDAVRKIKTIILEDIAKNKNCNFTQDQSKEYTDVIMTYLALCVDRCSDYWTTLAMWGYDFVAHTFGRQAIPITWDFAEINPFSNSTGNWEGAVNWVSNVVSYLKPMNKGQIKNLDAASTLNYEHIKPLISTDPPYYDMISYSDLSDFFYIWLRRTIKECYPDLFSTIVTPKNKELVADSSQFDETKENSKDRFLAGLQKAFANIKEKMNSEYPLTIYYAFKQKESEDNSDGEVVYSSTGWETMLQGLMNVGFKIVGTWPMRTERSARPRSVGSNALASSIVIVCRPRSENTALSTRREFITALKKELPAALKNLQEADIAPVDMAQSAIGPGMAIFSRYSKVLEADGTSMSVRTALQLINKELDAYFTEQESDMDKETRFCIAWYEQFCWKEGHFGDANTLATAKGTAVNALEQAGVIYAKAGKVRLLKRTELNVDWDPTTDKKLTVWECVQYLIKALEDKGESGAAEILKKIGGLSEPVKELAYRLYALCEKKGWTEDALAYNNLISSWQSVTDKAQFAAEISESTKKKLKDKEQKTLTDL